MLSSSAITTARRELDRGPHDADPHWTRTVSASEITEFEAAGRTDLGALTQAIRLRQATLDDTAKAPAKAPRDQANNRATLASILVLTGDMEQAIHHGLIIVPALGTTLTSKRVLQRLRPVRDAANTTAAAEFCDRFDTAARALATA
jgi:hypothetical protein